jgi:hypothetical protein
LNAARSRMMFQYSVLSAFLFASASAAPYSSHDDYMYPSPFREPA